MIKILSQIAYKQDYKIIIIDDDYAISSLLKDDIELFFKQHFHISVDPVIVATVDEASARLDKDSFDLGVVDLQLKDGLEGLDLIRKYYGKIAYKVVHTSKDDPEIINEIYDNGANSYLVKQLSAKRKQAMDGMLVAFLSKVYRQELEDYVFSKFKTNNKLLKLKIMDFLFSCQTNDRAVHITGETGTGKEVLAQLVQDFCIEPNLSLEVVHCGNLKEDNVQSKIFGHKKGSYTGAINDRRGVFEEANGKTLLLDEIGDLSSDMQTQLLRAIDKKEGKRRGCEVLRKYNVKVISATSADLQKLVENKVFKEDLEARLKGHFLTIPPLRERREDILLQINHYQKQGATRAAISQEVLDFLINDYSWSGNSRELSNLVDRWKGVSRKIVLEDIKDLIKKEQKNTFEEVSRLVATQVEKYGLDASMQSIELSVVKQLVEKTEKTTGWKSRLRRKIGISSNNKWTGIKERYLEQYGENL